MEMKVNNIKDNFGSRKKSKRLGRGIGSGKGKTCARGGKGQTARSGVAINGFEGGQMPLYRRLPKRGFTNYNRTEYVPVDIAQIHYYVSAGLLDASKITIESLKKVGLIKGKNLMVKALASSEIEGSFANMMIYVHAISENARKILENNGGGVTLIINPGDADMNSSGKKGKKTIRRDSAIVKARSFEQRRLVI